MNTEATEYSKSGTDDESARQESAAFDPTITDPGEQKAKAGEGKPVSLMFSDPQFPISCGRLDEEKKT